MSPNLPMPGDIKVIRLLAHTVKELPEYSTTLPTGVYPGKMWRAKNMWGEQKGLLGAPVPGLASTSRVEASHAAIIKAFDEFLIHARGKCEVLATIGEEGDHGAAANAGRFANEINVFEAVVNTNRDPLHGAPVGEVDTARNILADANWVDGWETGAYAVAVGCKPIAECDAYVAMLRTRRRRT